MTLAQVLLDIVLPLSIAIGCGAVVGMILRHRALHQARLRRAYDQLLNAGTVRPQGATRLRTRARAAATTRRRAERVRGG